MDRLSGNDELMTSLAALQLGGEEWSTVVLVIVGFSLILVVAVYRRLRAGVGMKWGAGGLKWLALVLLGVCLLEPLWSSPRVRSGENSVVIAVDTGASMQIADGPGLTPRSEQLRPWLTDQAPWQMQIARDFRLQRQVIAARVDPVGSFDGLTFEAAGSSLGKSLQRFAERSTADSIAAVVLMTDGHATDHSGLAGGASTGGLPDRSLLDPATLVGLPPIYAVVPDVDPLAFDMAIEHVAVNQSSFEDAPVTIQVTARATAGHPGRIRAQLFRVGDDSPEEQVAPLTGPTTSTASTSSPHVVDNTSQEVKGATTSSFATFRFQKRPTESVTFYRLRISAEPPDSVDSQELENLPTETPKSSPIGPGAPDTALTANERPLPPETTLANNERLVVVTRRPGPYRVLYVSGRPNWEFKFLRRAVSEDLDLGLVGLVRMARKEAKFDFRSRAGESGSALFRGFRDATQEAEESYDEPVVIALGVKDAEELPGGKFPLTLESLCRYDALIFDDIEAEFFSTDQVQMIESFVSQRGGGFLMLGGPDSFHDGNWDKTLLKDILPVYSERRRDVAELAPPAVPQNGGRSVTERSSQSWHLQLTRDGWLQPWVRLRTTDDAERQRLAETPAFQVVSRVPGIKPAAQVMSEVVNEAGEKAPALVAQTYGSGRSAALLIGDMWRWGMHREAGAEDDLSKSWRQTVRWLVADVPRRVEVGTIPITTGQSSARRIQVRVRDPEFAPQDNAAVKVDVLSPKDELLTLTAEPSTETPGLFEVDFVPREEGVYIASVRATDADGTELGIAETGWTHEPRVEEFRGTGVNRDFLEQICRQTGGRVIQASELDRLADELPDREAPQMELSALPLWHSPWMLTAIIFCLLGEWSWRRWKGIP